VTNTQSKSQFEKMRRAMVDSQLRTTNVSDPRVIAAMESVPREQFVPDDRAALAYVDVQIPLGAGRALNAPMAIGRLLNEANVQPGDHVLLIGAATGYTAALLSRLAARVVGVECEAALADFSRKALSSVSNVTILDGALERGGQQSTGDHGPYDLLFIDGAIEVLPETLTAQLKDGARIVGGTIEDGVTRLCQGRKIGGHVSLVSFIDADCAALPGFAKAKSFVF
jgi:protein-L-isoaspartate(D-aspartate) O-methyltransferase